MSDSPYTEQPVETCVHCGELIRFRVAGSRSSFEGFWVHEDTGVPSCGPVAEPS